MLVRFKVSNYLSFDKEVEFLMTPGLGRRNNHHKIKSNKSNVTDVLRAGVIYGANASGKSNLVKAIDFAVKLILQGTKPDQGIALIKFKLREKNLEMCSMFQFDFIIEGKSFTYGFEVEFDRICSEWLYETTKTSKKVIFKRITELNEEKIYKTKIDIRPGYKFENKNERKMIKLLNIRANQLFLTQSIDLGVMQFKKIFDWFKKIVIIFPTALYGNLILLFKSKNNFSDFMVKILKYFDAGISNMKLMEKDFENIKIPEKLKEDLRKNIQKEEGNKTKVALLHELVSNKRYLIDLEENELNMHQLMTEHNEVETGKVIDFELSEESDGTQRMMDLIPALHLALFKDYIFIVDEIDRSLHPNLCYKFIFLFLNYKNHKNGQFIVTTHDSNLLDLELLRKDEIWFIEKNQNFSSSVYSLDEFKDVRIDKDIKKSYLLGRFGGIPLIPNFKNLELEKEE